VPIIVAGLWSYSFYYEPVRNLNYSVPFINDLFVSINESSILSYLLSVIFISLGSFLVNSIFNKYEYFDKFIFLPALVYALGMSSNKDLFYFNPIIISNLFVLLAFLQLLQVNRNEGAKAQAFNFGLLIGVSSLFYITNVLIFPTVLFVLMSIKNFDIKEMVLSIVGVSVPLIYILIYAYLFANENFADYYSGLAFDINFKANWSIYEILYYSGLIIVSTISLFMLIPRYSKAGLRYKKIINIFMMFSFWITIWTVFNFFFLKEINFTAFMTIPLTFLLTFYLVYMKNQGLASFIFNIGLISLCLMVFL
jgi:hypothetical protein